MERIGPSLRHTCFPLALVFIVLRPGPVWARLQPKLHFYVQNNPRRKKRLSGGASAKDGSGGKWLPEEDDRLRTGVEHLGAKNWKRISEEYLDKRRTDVQCLHRWQKVRYCVFRSSIIVHVRVTIPTCDLCF